MPDDMIAIGEVGLGGEVRNVTNLDYRLVQVCPSGWIRPPGKPTDRMQFRPVPGRLQY